jgi:hypothetical protein
MPILTCRANGLISIFLRNPRSNAVSRIDDYGRSSPPNATRCIVRLDIGWKKVRVSTNLVTVHVLAPQPILSLLCGLVLEERR